MAPPWARAMLRVKRLRAITTDSTNESPIAPPDPGFPVICSPQITRVCRACVTMRLPSKHVSVRCCGTAAEWEASALNPKPRKAGSLCPGSCTLHVKQGRPRSCAPCFYRMCCR